MALVPAEGLAGDCGAESAPGCEGTCVGFISSKPGGGEQGWVPLFPCHAQGLMWCQLGGALREEDSRVAEVTVAQGYLPGSLLPLPGERGEMVSWLPI